MSLLKGVFEDSSFIHGTAPRPLQYIFNVGLSLSQMLSVILGGDPDESVSSRTGKAAIAGRWWFVHFQEPFIDWLLGEGHCRNAIEPDEGCKEIWSWVKEDNHGKDEDRD